MDRLCVETFGVGMSPCGIGIVEVCFPVISYYLAGWIERDGRVIVRIARWRKFRNGENRCSRYDFCSCNFRRLIRSDLRCLNLLRSGIRSLACGIMDGLNGGIRRIRNFKVGCSLWVANRDNTF